MKTTLKDKITNICAFIMALAGAVLLIEQNPSTANLIPHTVATTIEAAGILAASITSYLVGKTPNGTTPAV